MGVHFDALTGESKAAVEWKAKQNLNMALADGSERTLANQQKFIDNNREGLASNVEGLRHVIQEFKQYLASQSDD
jgi:hypothetical protein